MRIFSLMVLLSASLRLSAQPALKSVIYDFDGLDIGATNLPDGDYSNFDLDYHVVANPLTASNVLGDRVLQLDLNWSGGTGEFGKGISRYIELDAANDRFNFYIYNPLSNFAAAVADIVIKEDDNSSYAYEAASDDKWSYTTTIPRSGGWQLISVPLSSFADVNAGGNGIFDASYSGDKGMVLIIGITFHRSAAATGPEHYYVDMLSFSEGALATGSSILSMPVSNAANSCLTGCLAYRSPADSVPPEMEAMLGPGNKLRYVNIFMSYAYSGSVAVNLPGSAVQRLINNGYRPMITWEAMFSSYAPTDPIQPKLNDIIAGTYDTYIDAFANKIKTYSDTIIIRPFHEFDGNWYPWSLTLNGNDPLRFRNAWRHIVDRFDALGATNVLWCFCPNSSPTPSRAYNWSVNAYPGDAYVDIVATNVYNHPLTGTPPWRSFRSVAAESYYYLNHFFPAKPFMIPELACRERYSGENTASQSKAEWMCQMATDLRSWFDETEAIMFFQDIKEHDWRINSGAAALNAAQSCIWQEEYFGYLATGISATEQKENYIYPNPFEDMLYIRSLTEATVLNIYDLSGKLLRSLSVVPGELIQPELQSGLYIAEWTDQAGTRRQKLICRQSADY